MTEELAKNADVEKTETTETVVIPENKTNQERKFDQKEVDSLIQNRVKREKDTFTAKENGWNAEKQELETKVSTYEKQLQTILTKEMEGLSEGEKKLLAKLSILDQIEYLASVTKETKGMPITPKPNGQSGIEPKKKINNFFGG